MSLPRPDQRPNFWDFGLYIKNRLIVPYLLVIDWLEVDEVAVEDEVHVDPGDDQDLIARQCITGLTSRQNSG